MFEMNDCYPCLFVMRNQWVKRDERELKKQREFSVWEERGLFLASVNCVLLEITNLLMNELIGPIPTSSGGQLSISRVLFSIVILFGSGPSNDPVQFPQPSPIRIQRTHPIIMFYTFVSIEFISIPFA